jgi:hypothetical protein
VKAGGSTGAGGSVKTGGSTGAGGSVKTGGSTGAGGSPGTGGAPGAGGSLGTGGAGGAGQTCGTGSAVTSGGATGVWAKPSVPVTYSDCGSQTLVVDPVRSSDYYAFVCVTGGSIGVLKSTDYAQTWTRVDKTYDSGGAWPVDTFSGNPWGASIDPNPGRNPGTTPTFYAPAGYGALGVWKSTDGGVAWVRIRSLDTAIEPYSINDAYGVYVLADNPPNHVMVTFHSPWNTGRASLAESTDGGATWTIHPSGSYCGAGSYFMPTAVAGTWLTVGMSYGDSGGTWRTTTCGRSPDCNGTPSASAWTKVDDTDHTHGAFQHYLDPLNGWLYMPGSGGIKLSKDNGATWKSVYSTQWMSGIVATDKYLYANYFYGTTLLRATRSNGADWATYTSSPSGLTGGAAPYGNAASSDCTHWTVVTSNDDPGIWRYVEP